MLHTRCTHHSLLSTCDCRTAAVSVYREPTGWMAVQGMQRIHRNNAMRSKTSWCECNWAYSANIQCTPRRKNYHHSARCGAASKGGEIMAETMIPSKIQNSNYNNTAERIRVHIIRDVQSWGKGKHGRTITCWRLQFSTISGEKIILLCRSSISMEICLHTNFISPFIVLFCWFVDHYVLITPHKVQ